MKVGHLIHYDGAGGGAGSVVNMMRALRDAGHEQVVFLGGKGRIVAACEQWNIEYVSVPIHRKATLFWGMLKLVLALKHAKPDVLLVRGQWGGPVGTLAAWMVGVKSIYIIAWPSFYTDWTPWRTFQNALAEWIPCKLAKRVVALTPSVHCQYLFRGWAGEDKLVIIPNIVPQKGLPSRDDAVRIRQENGWAEDVVHVVSVGRLVDQKRVDWLLNAWKDVQATCPDARLWIVGDGPEKESLMTLAGRLGVAASCQFLGAKPNGIFYIAAADIVVMTTMYEGFGNVACEAMACGKPVIATAVDGVRENITDGLDGYLVPPGDIAALTKRIEQLVTNAKERRQMGAAGVQSVRRWDVERVMSQYGDLLRDVCK
jgi:glycosyltransferase involved in cell wall biosynthesis